MHGSPARPRGAPLVPRLELRRDALEVVDIDAIGHESGVPIVDRGLNAYVSRHAQFVSFVNRHYTERNASAQIHARTEIARAITTRADGYGQVRPRWCVPPRVQDWSDGGAGWRQRRSSLRVRAERF